MRRIAIGLFIISILNYGRTSLCAQTPNKIIDSLLIVLQSSSDDTSRLKILNKISLQYSRVEKFEESKKYAWDALSLTNDILKTANGNNLIIYITKMEMGNAHYRLANNNGATGNYPDALKEFGITLKIWEEIGNKNGAMITYHYMGNTYINQRNYPEALKSFMAALKIARDLNVKVRMAGAYANMGLVYSLQGNYSEALKNYFEALKLNEEAGGDKANSAGIKTNIGEMFMKQGNYDEAIKYFNACAEVFKNTGPEYDLAGVYINIGTIYLNQNNFPESRKYLTEALKIFKKLNRQYWKPTCYRLIAEGYLKEKNYAEAMTNLQEALKFSDVQNIEGMADVNNLMGKVLYTQAFFEKKPPADQKYKDALQYLNKGFELAKGVGNKEAIHNYYTFLSELYTNMNNYQKALEYYTLAVGIGDSLMNNETNRKIEQLRTQNEVEKAVAEEKVQEEKALAEQKFQNEKKLAEEKLKQEKLLADERVVNEKRLTEIKNRHALQTAEEKYQFELSLANERTGQEKIKAEEKLKKEQALAEEKLRSGEVLQATKAQQEKEKATIKRRNEFLMMGAGMLILTLFLLFLYLRQRTLKQKADERADAVHKMAELELQSLRAQLNPHFMFNSLNAIQDLILKEDIRSSHRYLSRFSKLLRMLLDNANQPFIPLKKELDFLELYLSLENLRIPDLHYSIKTEPGIDAETTLIPNMMMQPYIENAIWHGLSHKTNDKRLDVNIHRVNGSIQCDIEDNGVGRNKAEELKSLYRKEHRSKGMELLSKRFNLLSKEYGTEIQTRVTDLMNNGNAAGTLVEITVPLAFSKKTKEILNDTNHYN